MSPAAARVRAAYTRIREADRPEVFIHLRPEAAVVAEAERAEGALAGVVVAVKDNVDVAGLPTTCACPEFAYVPEESAPCVARLAAAGAVVNGKTNLDQFATGLVGTRSPYGAVRNAWRPERIAGGSSSGSAVAVSLGLADIGIGTDTAGSGRVPAALQGLVGFKPTPGLIPTAGVVPASVSYDCVNVFARTVREAEIAVAVMASPAGREWPADAPLAAPPVPVVAVPGDLGLDAAWSEAFAAAVAGLRDAGAVVLEIDGEPFLEGSRLLYETSLVAERYAAFGAFAEAHPQAIDSSVRAIVLRAGRHAAHDLVHARELVSRLRAHALSAFMSADALLLPTVSEHPTLAEVAAEPLEVNRRLGRFTAFANPFDLPAVSVPAGAVEGGPFGVTLYARPFADRVAADVARLVTGEAPGGSFGPPSVPLLVLGAHLSGQPLNYELTGRGARLVGPARTAPRYRLHALATQPPKPGLVPVAEDGVAIEGELWELPQAGLASLLAGLPEPMLLGAVELASGELVTGFLCHGLAAEGAEDISGFGGWLGYLAAAVR